MFSNLKNLATYACVVYSMYDTIIYKYILYVEFSRFSFFLIYNGNEVIDNPIVNYLFPFYQDI